MLALPQVTRPPEVSATWKLFVPMLTSPKLAKDAAVSVKRNVVTLVLPVIEVLVRSKSEVESESLASANVIVPSARPAEPERLLYTEHAFLVLFVYCAMMSVEASLKVTAPPNDEVPEMVVVPVLVSPPEAVRAPLKVLAPLAVRLESVTAPEKVAGGATVSDAPPMVTLPLNAALSASAFLARMDERDEPPKVTLLGAGICTTTACCSAAKVVAEYTALPKPTHTPLSVSPA